MFKFLNKSDSGMLTLNEFIKVYDAVTLRWVAYNPDKLWFESLPNGLQSICKGAHTIVSWPYFENIICKHLKVIILLVE